MSNHTCPKCGSPRVESGAWEKYACGTAVFPDGPVVDGNVCLQNQLAKRTKEFEEAIVECHEQTRLLGISVSTEAALIAKMERIMVAAGKWREEDYGDIVEDAKFLFVLVPEFGEDGW